MILLATLAAAALPWQAQAAQDITLAEATFHQMPRCGQVIVQEKPLVQAYISDGVPASTSQVYAETALNDCTITVSAGLVQQLEDASPVDQLDACFKLAHEYSHVIGYGDTTIPGSLFSFTDGHEYWLTLPCEQAYPQTIPNVLTHVYTSGGDFPWLAMPY